jgi:hypothetical protein
MPVLPLVLCSAPAEVTVSVLAAAMPTLPEMAPLLVASAMCW